MKRFRKSMLSMAATLLVIGIGLCLAGSSMGGQTSMVVNAFGEKIRVGACSFGFTASSFHESVGDTRTSGAQGLEAFQNIDVNINLGDVIIQAGDSYGVSLKWDGDGYELHWSNENGELSVWSTDGYMNLSNLDATVIITIPNDARFEQTNIQASLGKVDVSDLDAKTLTLNADLGEVDMQNIQAEEVWLTLELGNLTMNTITAGLLDVKASLGSVTGTNMDINNTTTVEANLGGVDLRGNFRTHVDLTADMGGIRMDTALPVSQCSYDLEADLGSVNVDGRSHGDSFSGGNGENYYTLNASMGGIDLNFGQ